MRSEECGTRNVQVRSEECGTRNVQARSEECGTRNENLRARTKAFALDVIRLVENLPRTQTSGVIAKQLLRSGTSVGSNYLAACRAKSRADFVAKMAIVEEEADESRYWMELLMEAGIVRREDVMGLMAEADELVAIAIASAKTARGGSRQGGVRNAK